MFVAIVGRPLEKLEDSTLVVAESVPALKDSLEAMARNQPGFEDDVDDFVVDDFIHQATGLVLDAESRAYVETDITDLMRDYIQGVYDDDAVDYAETMRQHAEDRVP